jgi:hypothetical protein
VASYWINSPMSSSSTVSCGLGEGDVDETLGDGDSLLSFGPGFDMVGKTGRIGAGLQEVGVMRLGVRPGASLSPPE